MQSKESTIKYTLKKLDKNQISKYVILIFFIRNIKNKKNYEELKSCHVGTISPIFFSITYLLEIVPP